MVDQETLRLFLVLPVLETAVHDYRDLVSGRLFVLEFVKLAGLHENHTISLF